MIASGVKPNTVSFNSMVDIHATNVGVESAQVWLERMVRSGSAPDNCTLHILRRALGTAGDDNGGANAAAYAHCLACDLVIDTYQRLGDAQGCRNWINMRSQA